MRKAIASEQVVTLEGIRRATILMDNGIIRDVLEQILPEAENVTPYAILPGLVDTHVHINDPGRTEWEGFRTATRAAAAGGYTTLVDMPLNSTPATTEPAALAAKRQSAEHQCHTDYAFWGGLVEGNEQQIEPLAQAGVRGFKSFLVPSGVEDFPHISPESLRRAAPAITKTGLPLLVHAELPGPIEIATSELHNADWNDYANYLASRPDESEIEAIRLLIDIAEQHHTRIHIVHLATAKALPELREARAKGLPITVETCPHYLHFSAGQIPSAATIFKCAPPIRSSANRDQLWQALRNGDIDLIATDHSPCIPELKEGDFQKAWGGIASLSLALSIIWTETKQRGGTLHQVARWMSQAPARLAGVGKTKGRIAKGFDADLVVFDPETTFRVEPQHLHYRHRISAYLGETLNGTVRQTILRGELAYIEGGGFPSPRGWEVT